MEAILLKHIKNNRRYKIALENSVASQGKTMDETTENLREAPSLYYEIKLCRIILTIHTRLSPRKWTAGCFIPDAAKIFGYPRDLSASGHGMYINLKRLQTGYP